MDHVAQRIREIDPTARVCCAFLELTSPDLLTLVSDLATEEVTDIVIFPMFLGVGKHVREDLPLLVKTLSLTHPEIRFRLSPPVGEEPQVIDLLAKIALSLLPSK
jgi:sirohydrochlorin cobaltochelatase